MVDTSLTKRHAFRLPVEHKDFDVVVTQDQCLELYVDGCLRKRCSPIEETDLLYVWTNIELLWEEHKYIEARYSIDTKLLHVTVNRESVLNAKCA